MFKQLLLSICCISFSLAIHAAKVDTVEITSTFLQRKVKIAVVTPRGYQSGQATYPTLYLLHGGNGKFSDWLMAPIGNCTAAFCTTKPHTNTPSTLAHIPGNIGRMRCRIM